MRGGSSSFVVVVVVVFFLIMINLKFFTSINGLAQRSPLAFERERERERQWPENDSIHPRLLCKKF